MPRHSSSICVMVLSGLLLAGCGGEEVRPASSVTGKVTLDGQPLTSGSIQFTSTKTGESAYDNLDGEGQYAITFPETDFDTQYEVTVGPPVEENLDATQLAENPPPKVANPVPRKYSDRTTSGLTAKLDESGETVRNFDLKSR